MAASPDTHRRTWSAVLDGPLNELAEGDRQQRHLSRSDFVRLAIATFLGDPSLATISKGRPKKD